MRTIVVFIALLLLTNIWCSNLRAENTEHGVRVVVLDAGHGGWDPGAHYAGISEKDLVLKVVLKVGDLIEERMPGVKVVYTRKTDKALGDNKLKDLQARADIANRAGGDIFISVHANAAAARAAYGVETFVMGESSKEQRYNEDALYAHHKEELIDMSDARTAAIVRAYLQNLQFTYGQYSQALAQSIQTGYVGAKRHSRGVKRQLLRVLYASDMPSVLTEIGFMTNANEMAYMKSEKGQNGLAEAIYKGVRSYSDQLLKVRQSDTTAPTTVAQIEQDDDHIVYAVQLMASGKSIKPTKREFGKYVDEVKEYTAQGQYMYKYCIGEYKTKEEAQKRASQLKKEFGSAFVVRCRGYRVVK